MRARGELMTPVLGEAHVLSGGLRRSDQPWTNHRTD